jgi:hypothetical protein
MDMRRTSLSGVTVFAAIIALLISGAAVADEPVDNTLPAVTGVPYPDVAPWTGHQSGAGGRVGVIDDFNRADGPLGPDWTVQAGDVVISNQAATGDVFSIATHNTATGDHVEIDVEINPTAGLQYAAAILNYGGGVNNIFVKIQNNDSGPVWDRMFCYVGNSGGPWSGLDPYFFDVSPQFSTARMVVDIDVSRNVSVLFTNVDGGSLPDQQYNCPNAPAAEGPALGIGTYGSYSVRIDNFGDGPIPVELMAISVD